MDDYTIQAPNKEEPYENYKGFYSVDDFRQVRKFMLDECYSKQGTTKTKLVCKLKCGILSSDVIDYFIHEKKDLPDDDADSLPENDNSIIEIPSSENITNRNHEEDEEDDDEEKLIIINDDKLDESPNMKSLKTSALVNSNSNQVWVMQKK